MIADLKLFVIFKRLSLYFELLVKFTGIIVAHVN